MQLAHERGPCPDAADQGVMERFSCKMAIAPTASISIICGGTSACIEPIPANIYTHKTLSGIVLDQEPVSGEAARDQEQGQRRGVELHPRARRIGAASRLPHADEKDVLQDQLRDRPALADRARRRPHAVYRPGAIAQPVHPRRRRQVGPADAPLPARGSWGSSRSITCARSRCSAPGSRAGSRATTRSSSSRSMPPRPIMMSAWRASESQRPNRPFALSEVEVRVAGGALAARPSTSLRTNGVG